MLEGHYAQKQIGCKSRVIAWSHGARFKKAVELASAYSDGKLLDYGSGDGSFLAMVRDRFPVCAGSDIAEDQIVDCRQRFGAYSNMEFYTIEELLAPEHTGAYRVITCMETLEHCPEPAVDRVLSDMVRLAAPDARIIISVPIEIGPTFLLKYSIRTVAGWRGIGDYRHYEKYTPAAALKMILATADSVIERPIYGSKEAPFHSHYGFNWRRLRKRIEQSLTVEKTLYSPLGFLGGWFSSQAWFLCRPKAR
ncbi:MAG: methyltransferase domain-containing protein [Capsulimonadales bacterium]|nr:methyltransferase domain-containing protein [Capsulimonadales bacterium]